MKIPTEEELAYPDLANDDLVAALHVIPEWTEPYIAYLVHGEFPGQEILDRRIIRRAKSYTVINGELYKRSPSGVFLRCVSPEEGRNILR